MQSSPPYWLQALAVKGQEHGHTGGLFHKNSHQHLPWVGAMLHLQGAVPALREHEGCHGQARNQVVQLVLMGVTQGGKIQNPPSPNTERSQEIKQKKKKKKPGALGRVSPYGTRLSFAVG